MADITTTDQGESSCKIADTATENATPERARAKVLRLLPRAEQNEAFVSMLEDWLATAKSGRLTSLIIAGVVDGDLESQFEGNYLEAIAAAELVKSHVLETVVEDDDE